MTCKRCEDIHSAQKDGKTQNECKCDCHNDNSTLWFNDQSGTLTVPCTTATTATLDFSNAGGAFSFATLPAGTNDAFVYDNMDFTDGVAPEDLGVVTGIRYNCTCLTSSEQCDDCKKKNNPTAYPCTCDFGIDGNYIQCDYCIKNGVPKPQDHSFGDNT